MSLTETPSNPQRVALVTGGAVRVGRAIAEGLAAAGYDVAFTHNTSPLEAKMVESQIRSMGRSALTVGADLSTPEGCDAVVRSCIDTFGRLDLVVSSAASFDSAALEEVDADHWDAVLAINARAPHLVARAALPHLREFGGSIVNIVDLSAFQPWATHPVHAVSKAALAHLTRVQARAYGPEVRVNAVAPGAVLPPDDWSPDRSTALAEDAALGRVGTPQDVVDAVLYLSDATFVTGEILTVDGGRRDGPSGPPA